MSGESLTPIPVLVHVWRDRRVRIAKWGFIALILVAVFADFIANDTPLYCKTEGISRYPALHEMLAGVGLTSWSLEQESTDWKAANYQLVIFALIPYSAKETDLKNANFRSPFETQEVKSMRYRHWLGTDHLGRDVFAGLIHGTRITLLVGLFSMFLAALLGIPVGALAGYLGDDRCRIRFPQLLSMIIFSLLTIYFIALAILADGNTVFKAIFLACVSILLLLFVHLAFRKWFVSKSVRIPVDTLTIRSIEIIRSIPLFFLLFAILGMLRTPGILYVILLIALLWSPSIMRFVRAEALKLRDQTFIQSATVLGLSHSQIVWRHVIPNAIGPALITIAFGIGSAVLVESGLSFLGIGIAPETISWGKMLNVARSNFSAWWMALLPGLAIFLTIAIFNRLGDVLENRISGRE